MDEEKIRAKITEYTTRRDQYVQQANREIAAFNGAIAALEALLEPEPEKEPEAQA